MSASQTLGVKRHVDLLVRWFRAMTHIGKQWTYTTGKNQHAQNVRVIETNSVLGLLAILNGMIQALQLPRVVLCASL